MSRFLACLMLAAVASSAYGDIRIDSFDREFDRIDHMRAEVVGSAAKAKAFRELIAKYADDPRRGKAMLRLAAICREGGVGERDDKGAMAWNREAMNVSKPGSDVWADATMRVMQSLRESEQFEDAEKLAVEFKKHRKDVLSQARANMVLQQIAYESGKLQLAFDYCCEIMDVDPKGISYVAKTEMDLLQQASLYAMVSVLKKSDAPDAKVLLADVQMKYGYILLFSQSSKVELITEDKPTD
ncbi:MAG: hypothetical protein SGJ20_05075 [Planctomycetota bacterium]|nr:hypothetical protein [Planctomycetota bacterium]